MISIWIQDAPPALARWYQAMTAPRHSCAMWNNIMIVQMMPSLQLFYTLYAAYTRMYEPLV